MRSPQSHSPRPSWCSSPGAVARYTNPFPGADIGDIADQPVSRTFGGGIPHRSRSGREPQHDRRDDGADLAAGLCGLQDLGAHWRVRTASRSTTTPLLARGLRTQVPGRPVEGRIIPARAGFTLLFMAPPAAGPDHPRSRGVYVEAVLVHEASSGSSPLARGLPRPEDRGLGTPGIIPARAGFTAAGSSGCPPTGDHPRSRGVYLDEAPLPLHDEGSSPLARGLRSHLRIVPDKDRIIPARAGFTGGISGRRAWMPDHPRSRGVYMRGVSGHGVAIGSSPLARGLRQVEGPDGSRRRIIPARAGFTLQYSFDYCGGWDHPRSRGVYFRGPRRWIRPRGSSPLARGLRPPGAFGVVGGGIIPARAGFTRTSP